MAKKTVSHRKARGKYIEVTLSDAEHSAIKVKADAQGMSLAGFLRLAALERAGRVAMV